MGKNTKRKGKRQKGDTAKHTYEEPSRKNKRRRLSCEPASPAELPNGGNHDKQTEKNSTRSVENLRNVVPRDVETVDLNNNAVLGKSKVTAHAYGTRSKGNSNANSNRQRLRIRNDDYVWITNKAATGRRPTEGTVYSKTGKLPVTKVTQSRKQAAKPWLDPCLVCEDSFDEFIATGKRDSINKTSKPFPTVENEVMVTVHAPEDGFGDTDVDSDDSDDQPVEVIAEVGMSQGSTEGIGNENNDTEQFGSSLHNNPQFRQLLDEMVEERIRSRGKKLYNKNSVFLAILSKKPK